MITKPLELSSKLKKHPNSFGSLFFINAGLIVLFFTLFGSRFVLSPGLGISFQLPVMQDTIVTANPTDIIIAVRRSDMALVDGAVLDFSQLQVWLKIQAEKNKPCRLLVQADRTLSTGDLTEIYEMAKEAGFSGVQVAAEAKPE